MSQLARAKLDNDDTFRLLVSRSLFGVNDWCQAQRNGFLTIKGDCINYSKASSDQPDYDNFTNRRNGPLILMRTIITHPY
jgi:hypothetical protein